MAPWLRTSAYHCTFGTHSSWVQIIGWKRGSLDCKFRRAQDLVLYKMGCVKLLDLGQDRGPFLMLMLALAANKTKTTFQQDSKICSMESLTPSMQK